MNENAIDDVTQSPADPAGVGQVTPETEGDADHAAGEVEPETEPDTFPRSVVERLRRENAKYRDRAGQTDVLARRLHVELVRATGRLADPTDLEFDPAHLEDGEAMTAAVDALLAAKPHLASRRPTGDIGQGVSGATPAAVDLAGMLRASAW